MKYHPLITNDKLAFIVTHSNALILNDILATEYSVVVRGEVLAFRLLIFATLAVLAHPLGPRPPPPGSRRMPARSFHGRRRATKEVNDKRTGYAF